MSVVHSPPSTSHLVERGAACARMSALEPRLFGTNEMDHVDARLEMLISGYVLVVGGGCNIVGEAEAVVVVLEVHVDEALIGAVERYVPLSHCHHGIVVAKVRGQHHNTSVEQIGPADIGGCREGMSDV